VNAWQFLRSINELCHFQTREGKRVGAASNSELKRWCQSKAFIINGEAVAWDEPIDFPVFSVVLFPKHPVTLL
jgi:ATP-dependent DNA ligase